MVVGTGKINPFCCVHVFYFSSGRGGIHDRSHAGGASGLRPDSAAWCRNDISCHVSRIERIAEILIGAGVGKLRVLMGCKRYLVCAGCTNTICHAPLKNGGSSDSKTGDGCGGKVRGNNGGSGTAYLCPCSDAIKRCGSRHLCGRSAYILVWSGTAWRRWSVIRDPDLISIAATLVGNSPAENINPDGCG